MSNLSSLALFANSKFAVWFTPLWTVGLTALGILVLLFAVFMIYRQLFPRAAAVTWTTAQDAVFQPLFWLLLSVGAFILAFFPFLPYFTLGDDLKVVKENGLQLISVLAMFQALWVASTSIFQELEGKTALLILSKPIGRREYIFGKFFGVLGPVALMFIILGVVFLASVSFKVVHESRESGLPVPTSEQCYDQIVHIAPGLALAFMATCVIASIAVAISTRLPILPNIVICLSIYMIGNLVPMMVNQGDSAYGLVTWMGQFFATIFPVLDYFAVYPAIATEDPIPLNYMFGCAAYAILYSSVAMLISLLMFEDRDLA